MSSLSVPEQEPETFAFGPFLLIPERQQLRKGETAIRLGSRALALLTALVERPGEVVTKRELFERAWPDTFVEEGSLKVNMAALRRALSDDFGTAQYLATAVGRGYRFIAPVQRKGSYRAVANPSRSHNLPKRNASIVGRAGAVDAIEEALTDSRLVSVVGAGGVGKTTVALAVAERFVESAHDSVWFVDLAGLDDPGAVPSAIALEVGLPVSDNALESLCGSLRACKGLLLLDGCERLIEAVASSVGRLLVGTSDLKILTTSREPLRVAGEGLFRLPALDCPPLPSPATMREVLAYPAVELFVDRAKGVSKSVQFSDRDAEHVARICRGLDGLPLAIEIAATGVEVFAMEELSALLPYGLHRLSGLRAVHERQRSLSATIDWSYDLLTEGEQWLMRRLAIIPGEFNLASACALGIPANADTDTITRDLASLVAKSLVVADTEPGEAVYRLLDTTRAFALQKLAESGEIDRIRFHFTGQVHDAVGGLIRGRNPVIHPSSTQDSRQISHSAWPCGEDSLGTALTRSRRIAETAALTLAAPPQ